MSEVIDPTSPSIDAADDDAVLANSQRQRLKIAQRFQESGDPKDAYAALSALKDLDSQVLARRKQQLDKKVSDDNARAADRITEMRNELLRRKVNPFHRDNIGNSQVVRSDVVPTAFDGVATPSPQVLNRKRIENNYNDFVEEYDKANPPKEKPTS